MEIKNTIAALILAVSFCNCGFGATEDGLERLKNLSMENFEISEIKTLKTGDRLEDATELKYDITAVYLHAKKPSEVEICVTLPDAKNWNKIFVGTGNGGMGGNLISRAALLFSNKGYASVNCNLGTANWQKATNMDIAVADFGHDAVYKMTVAGKKIVETFYGEKPKYSYYSGGSTGGQEGLSMAQRHPEQYDGISVRFPVTNRTRLHIRFAYEKRLLKNTESFSDEKIRRITAEIVEQNRNNAGEYKDSTRPYLRFPERAHVDYSKFDFLTENEVEILKKVHSDFVDDKTGEFVTYKLPPTCEIADGGKSLKKGFDCWLYRWFFKPENPDVTKIDMPAYVKEFEHRYADEMNAIPDLEKFRARKGKLLIIQGKIDTVVPAAYVKQYYSELCKRSGGFDITKDFARLYLVAGGWHGNLGFDEMSVLRNWCERGEIPEEIDTVIKILDNTYAEKAELFTPYCGQN